jgi:hypothetical protein
MGESRELLEFVGECGILTNSLYVGECRRRDKKWEGEEGGEGGCLIVGLRGGVGIYGRQERGRRLVRAEEPVE